MRNWRCPEFTETLASRLSCGIQVIVYRLANLPVLREAFLPVVEGSPKLSNKNKKLSCFSRNQEWAKDGGTNRSQKHPPSQPKEVLDQKGKA